MFTQQEILLARSTFEAVKRIARVKGKKWKWEPRIGDWVVEKESNCVTGIITECSKETQRVCYVLPKSEEERPIGTEVIGCPVENIFPLHHWEEIEQLLGSLGYVIDIEKLNTCFRCGIAEKESLLYKSVAIGKTRQEATMRAVIGLAGEEVKDPLNPDLSKVFEPQIVCKFPERKKDRRESK